MNVKALLTTIALSSMSAVLCADSLTVIEINPGSGVAESAPLSIPEGHIFQMSLMSGNENGAKEGLQGVKIIIGTKTYTLNNTGLFYPYTGSSQIYGTQLTSYASWHPMAGPATVSVFSSGVPARLQVYVRPLLNSTIVTLDDSITNKIINIPNNTVLHLQKINEFMSTNANVKFTSSTGAVYKNPFYASPGGSGGNPSSMRLAAIAPVKVNLYTNSSINNTLAPPMGYNDYVSPNSFYIGPGVLELSQSITSIPSQFAYSMSGASYSTFTSQSTNSTNASVPISPQNINIVLEKTYDLQNWFAIDSFYITETAGKAFYRLRVSSN